MNIGAIGWWSYDNQGDLAMLAALRQGLSPHRIVPLDVGFVANADAIYRLNRLDYVILGGGTLIAEKPAAPFDTFDLWQTQLHSPLGVVGLGIDPIADTYRSAANALVDQARFFVARDQAGKHLLGCSKVQVAPDLTFAYPLPVTSHGLEKRERPICGVNLRKSPRLDPQPWLEAIAQLSVDVRGIPLSPFSSFEEGQLLKYLDPDMPAAHDPDLYSGLDLIIGTAFHSVLFAVQAGIPVIAIAYAPKVRNFMEDNGLGRYLLSADEWGRLPALVDEVLANRSQVVQTLRTVREKLNRDAKHMLLDVRGEVERVGQRHMPAVSSVTIIVMGCGDAEKDALTLTSCISQTHENTKILFSPQEKLATLPKLAIDASVKMLAITDGSYGSRLQDALAQSQTTYITWLDGGERLAEDALDCLVSLMDATPDCDVIYTDYWQVADNMPVGIHDVPESSKLYRRDVIGPCFLVRKALLDGVSDFPADSPLVTYSLWLQVSSTGRFHAFHAPLMYSHRQPHSRTAAVCERTTRRRWRAPLPRWRGAMWHIIDSDFGERFIVQPIAFLRRLLRSLIYDKS